MNMLNNEKKNLILKAAEKRFERLGYNLTTIDDIAKDLRIAKSGIFYYFKSKDDLYNILLLKQTNIFFNNLENNLPNSENPHIFFCEQIFSIKKNYKILYRLFLSYQDDKLTPYEVDLMKDIQNRFDKIFNSLFPDCNENNKLVFLDIVISLFYKTKFFQLDNDEHINIIAEHIIKILKN